MAQKASMNRGTSSIPGRLLTGTAVSVLTTLVISAVCAALISKEMLAEENTGYCAMVILLLSSLAGAKAGVMHNKEKNLYMGLIIGAIYLAVLLTITAIIFDAQYQGIRVSTIVVLAGCMLSMLLGQNGGKNVKLRRSKKHRR